MYKVRNFNNLIGDQRSKPQKAAKPEKSKSVSASPENAAKEVKRRRRKSKPKSTEEVKKSKSRRKRDIPK